MPAKIDISGQRFGRLTVVCEAGRKADKLLGFADVIVGMNTSQKGATCVVVM